MERVNIGNSVTLYCGDSRDILPTLAHFDVLLTDPPWGVEGGRGGDTRKVAKAAYGDAFQDTPDYIADLCVPLLNDALARATRGAITPGVRCLHLYPQASDVGCFFTPASVTHGPWGFTVFTPILYYGKDYRAGRGPLPSGTTVTEAAPKNGHPCPKPLRAWRWLLNKVSQPGEVVLDPFMGSGTTGVACVAMGRTFVGIELDKRYFDIACKRIEEATKQPDLFFEKAASEDVEPLDLFA